MDRVSSSASLESVSPQFVSVIVVQTVQTGLMKQDVVSWELDVFSYNKFFPQQILCKLEAMVAGFKDLTFRTISGMLILASTSFISNCYCIALFFPGVQSFIDPCITSEIYN